MSLSSFSSFGPLELVGFVFSLPLFSFFIALYVVGGILLVASRPGRVERRATPVSAGTASVVRARYLWERRALGITAGAVVTVFAVENVLRGYVLDLVGVIPWWRYATPLFCAFVGICVVLGLIATRGTSPSETPVLPTARRAWFSFSSWRDLVGTGIVLLLLVVTTIATGSASSPDREGRYVWLEISVPNESGIDPIRLGFYGWAYGVPVLVCVAALIAATWALLHRNAARPYIRPETLGAEREARREIARETVRIATAGALLALAGAWRLVADSGSVSRLVITGENEGNPYDVIWRHAELAVAAGWCAPVLEVAAFALLLLAIVRLRHPSTAKPTADGAEQEIGVEALR